jgi:hypothetical protein
MARHEWVAVMTVSLWNSPLPYPADLANHLRTPHIVMLRAELDEWIAAGADFELLIPAV